MNRVRNPFSSPGRSWSVVLATIVWGMSLFCADQSAAQDNLQTPVIATAADRQRILAADRGDYTYGYWLNGMRRDPGDPSPNLLCFETGHYGFQIDVDHPQNAKFALIEDDVSFEQTLSSGTSRMTSLAGAKLGFEVIHDNRTYRMVGHRDDNQAVRLWESGELYQHFEVQSLVFEDDQGDRLDCNANLRLIAWPKSLTLVGNLSPSHRYESGPSHGKVGKSLCIIDQPRDIAHQAAIDPAEFTAEMWFLRPQSVGQTGLWLLCKNSHEQMEGNFGFQLIGKRFVATMNVGGGKAGRYSVGTAPPLEVDRWTHLAMTYDGKQMRFFVDGKPSGEVGINRPRVPGEGTLRLGKRADGFGPDTPGLYDEVRIWNRALTPAEILQHVRKPNVRPERGLVMEETFDSPGDADYEAPSWTDATVRLSLTGDGLDWQEQLTHEQLTDGQAWNVGDSKRVILNCNVADAAVDHASVAIQVGGANGQSFPVRFDKTKNSRGVLIEKLSRDVSPEDLGPKRHYDDFVITVDNQGSQMDRVPFHVDLRSVYGITGLCPMLCLEDGTPTGVPVQLSKNWHDRSLGAYLRAFMVLPAAPGRTTYRFRVVYGFYGRLPSASHAQLSLVGYGGHGRWDQLAIGSWGETFCLDMDMSCTDRAITDVRSLMLRNGVDGKQWDWTDGGWGGDWGIFKNEQGQKLHFSEMKTAYFAHGPCLSDVGYRGYYGVDRQVRIGSRVQTLRTDDYARTFSELGYKFLSRVSAEGACFFKVGGTKVIRTPEVVYGNREGVLGRKTLESLKGDGAPLLERFELSGEGPWWVAFPGMRFVDGKEWGTGWRALIIRAYEASFSGKKTGQPSISLPVESAEGKAIYADLELTPPADVQSIEPGDFVRLDAQWMTLPRVSADYYGPNEMFRQHINDSPSSWSTVFREAVGNDLGVSVTGGTLLKNYPILIKVAEPQVKVKIRGGVGFVPIRFEGLTTTQGYSLYQIRDGKPVKWDQSRLGNDDWQTDYDSETMTYKMTFNIGLDGLQQSEWLFTRE